MRESEDAETTHVLIVEELPGDKPTRKQRKVRQAPQAGVLTLSRVTVVDAVEVELERPERIKAAVAVVEKALHVKALAGRDPHSLLSIPQWIGLRVGVGSGEQVAHSDWLEAEEIPPAESQKASRRRAEPVKGRFAELLGGKGSAEERAQLEESPELVNALRDLLSRRG